MVKQKQKYYRLTVEQTSQDLRTNLENGLTKREAKKRLARLNKSKRIKERSTFHLLIAQFLSPITLILLIATIIGTLAALA